MEQTDAQLIEEVLEGNIASFGVLVRRYQGVVYGLAYHIVKNFMDAEDLAQEAFLQAYVELRQLRDPSRFAGWLRRIACNTCNMWLRRRHIDHVSLDEAKEKGSAGPALVHDAETVVERKELCDAVLKAISSLSDKNRLAVTLFYMDGLSYRQISEFLEVPVTTIESRLHKARKQLKAGMMQMVKQDFNERKLGPEFAHKIAEGVLEIPQHGGALVRGEHRKDDIYVPPILIMEFGLKNGDVIKGKTRPGARTEKGGIQHEFYEIQAVNNDEDAVRYDMMVEGVLEIVPVPGDETGYGFVRQGERGKADTYEPTKDDFYMSPSQIRKFGLKTGDVIKGKGLPPAPEGRGVRYHALIYIDKVNNEDPRRG